MVTWNAGGAVGSFSWVDTPAIYHVNANSFSFADGHAEIVVPGNDACPGQSPGPSFCPAVDPIFDGLRSSGKRAQNNAQLEQVKQMRVDRERRVNYPATG